MNAPEVICNVNDREAPRYVITRMLTRAGFRVVEAVNGMEALAVARDERPAAIVLDLQLPDIDGMEVCRRLKADPATASIAVLQTSAAFISLEDKVHGLEHGADAFLAQPFTAQELIATLNSLLRIKERETTQLRRAEALAEADQRKDEFLAMLAHELRNPLAAVTTAHAILDAYPARDSTEARARDIARRQAAQLGRIVDDLLDVSRMMRGIITLQRERVDLAALLGQVTTLASEVKLRGQDRKLTLSAPQPVLIDGDPTRLLQIFSNLIDNAIKFTVPGGAIDVSLREADGMAVVCVRDDGVGMEPAALEQVFTLFFQAQTSIHRSRGGLGIGLTLTRALAQLHGGSVVARSEGPGHGVEIEVRLPLAAADSTVDPRPEPAASTRAIRLLIVEDNADVREILETLCDSWGHEVHVACDGLEGAAMALALLPDVALVDIGLPGIDGFEVARRIRADPRGSAIKLIALSGYGSPEQRAEGKAAGFDHHLVKPADPEHLAALLLSATEPA
ncbi:MAG TPA: response regulator [Nannocystis sp.]|jgi:signal transduction histidine kinase